MPLSRSIGRAISVVTFTAVQWAKAVDERNPFVMDLLAQPLVSLKGSVHAAA